MKKKNRQAEFAAKKAAAKQRNLKIIYAIIAAAAVVGIVFLFQYSKEYGMGAAGMAVLLVVIYFVKKMSDKIAESKVD